ncbi:HipA domain-containing protein [Bradyrhizobium sp. CW1]|uniref:type II toxin-antitoxin system HipA family toxin n=1 Tax=Bradyrhizobium sp. CW1 TaxID=2782686 RepID=UPI001FFF6F3C|nr:HipA domain-containing protein [Bradyrhizobium sp. CW1]UPJ26491.1 HipA domain-containing protein [Bradyrhizobium sp. CW1]
MTLRKAEVLFKDQPAGTFEETANGGTRFIYTPNWQTPIACALPVLQREHEWPQGEHPFFQHLGPEGWLREKQARTAHIAEEDDFGLLLRYGADCIGAVGVRRLAGDKGKDVEPAAEVTASPGRTVSGVQRKLLVVKEGNRFTPAGADGFAPYIAKFNSEREAVQSLVRNEALSLRWSAEVLGKDEVNEFVLGNVAVLNEPALIVTRFDRKPDGTKLRLEDFAQILSKPRGRDFAGKYDASYEDVANVIKQYSVRPEIDLARFFRRLVVFALVGNCDAHLKNFSLLETDAGLRLSPAYDIVNTAFYDGFDQNLALSIGGKTIPLDQVTRATLENFGKSIGLAPRAIEQTFADLKSRVQRATKILQPPQGEPPEGFVHRYQEIVSRACLRILGE